MYQTIVVPVALAHTELLDKALTTAADLARHYGAAAHMVAVTSPEANEVAHTPQEFKGKLEAFAAEQGQARGVEFQPHTVITPDPIRELDRRLGESIHELGADLVVMASHVPTFRDHIFTSNAGFLVTHSDVSVFVVR